MDDNQWSRERIQRMIQESDERLANERLGDEHSTDEHDDRTIAEAIMAYIDSFEFSTADIEILRAEFHDTGADEDLYRLVRGAVVGSIDDDQIDPRRYDAIVAVYEQQIARGVNERTAKMAALYIDEQEQLRRNRRE